MIEKSHIIEKTGLLFKASGIRTNTMDDIASAVGISKKTLYQFVKDKNELITVVIEQEYTKIKTSIEIIVQTSENCIEELLRLNALINRLLTSINPVAIVELKKLYQSIYLEWKQKFQHLFAKTIRNNIQKGKATGIYRADLNEEVITKIHTDKIDQIHDSNTFLSNEVNKPLVIKEMLTYYIRGLISKQGEIVLNKQLEQFNEYIYEEI